MFQYTPKKKILRDLQVPKIGNWYDKEYIKRREILKSFGMPQDYSMCFVFDRSFKTTNFFSENQVQRVPVGGYLFPVEMFDCKEVKE